MARRNRNLAGPGEHSYYRTALGDIPPKTQALANTLGELNRIYEVLKPLGEQAVAVALTVNKSVVDTGKPADQSMIKQD